MSWYASDFYKPYVSVAARRAKVQRELARAVKRGEDISPVTIVGRTIASSFWGKAWCDNLESYSDYANRMPRGRSYVRNGSVMDLQIGAGKVTAMVSGSSLYTITVTVAPLAAGRWKSITAACAGKIDSLVELLQGKLSRPVLELLARRGDGLFPEPKELELSCTCPDWASMCKHIAAALYGVGARLDARPELFFTLRQVDQTALITTTGATTAFGARPESKALASSKGLSSLFGIELDGDAAAVPAPGRAAKPRGSATPTPSRAPAAPPARPARPFRPAKVAARTLIDRGISRSMIATWLRAGHLERTSERGVYQTTPTTRRQLRGFPR